MKIPFAIWGIFPVLLFVWIGKIVPMPLELDTFFLGLALGCLIAQTVSLYHIIKTSRAC